MKEKHKTNQIYFADDEALRGYFDTAAVSQALHSHPFWELSYAYEGMGSCHTDSGVIPMQTGSLLLCSPDALHCLSSLSEKEHSPLRFCSIIFTSDFFNSLFAELETLTEIKEYSLFQLLKKGIPFSLSIQDDNALNLRHLIWLITHEYNHFTSGSRQIITHSMLCCMICLIRLLETQSGRTTSMITKNAILDDLLKYIRANYGSRLTLAQLAQYTHLSREYLCRYFKKQTGKNISEYILEVRMEKAKDMLRTTTHTVTDIACHCGYPSVSSFQRCFKTCTGMTPGQYRSLKGQTV